MRAGDLRHRVTIEAPTKATAPKTGERTSTYSPVATIPASVWPKSAKEGEEAQRPVHRISHEVRMRYTPLLTSDCRLIFNGRTLEIVSVVNVDERNRELRIQASEIT